MQGVRKPSVIFFNRAYPPVRGATGRMLRDLAQAFSADGWDVTVVTTGPQNNKENDGNVRIVRVRAGGGRRWSLFAFVKLWFKFLVTGMILPRHDLIVTMSDPPLFVVAGRILARRKKSRHINWCQDLYPDLLPALGMHIPRGLMQWFKVMSRRAMKSCDKVVVIGRCMARHLTHGGMDPRRIAVIPNWYDSELISMNGRRGMTAASAAARHRPLARAMEAARPYSQLFRDDERKFRVLYAGNMLSLIHI